MTQEERIKAWRDLMFRSLPHDVYHIIVDLSNFKPVKDEDLKKIDELRLHLTRRS